MAPAAPNGIDVVFAAEDKEEDMSSPDIDVYEYDDGEGGYYGRGTIEHNLKSGEVKVEYHDSENEADVG